MCPSTLYDNNVYHFHQRFIALSGSGLAEGNALLHRVSSSMEKASLGLFWPAHPLQIVSCISLSSFQAPAGSLSPWSQSSSDPFPQSSNAAFSVCSGMSDCLAGVRLGKCRTLSLRFDVSSTFTFLEREFLFGFVSIIASLHCCRWHFGDTRWELPLRITDLCQTA